MAKTTKKLIALLLAIVMITTLVSPSNYNWSNAAETRGGDNYATETDALAMLADAAITGSLEDYITGATISNGSTEIYGTTRTDRPANAPLPVDPNDPTKTAGDVRVLLDIVFPEELVKDIRDSGEDAVFRYTMPDTIKFNDDILNQDIKDKDGSVIGKYSVINEVLIATIDHTAASIQNGMQLDANFGAWVNIDLSKSNEKNEVENKFSSKVAITTPVDFKPDLDVVKTASEGRVSDPDDGYVYFDYTVEVSSPHGTGKESLTFFDSLTNNVSGVVPEVTGLKVIKSDGTDCSSLLTYNSGSSSIEGTLTSLNPKESYKITYTVRNKVGDLAQDIVNLNQKNEVEAKNSKVDKKAETNKGFKYVKDGATDIKVSKSSEGVYADADNNQTTFRYKVVVSSEYGSDGDITLNDVLANTLDSKLGTDAKRTVQNVSCKLKDNTTGQYTDVSSEGYVTPADGTIDNGDKVVSGTLPKLNANSQYEITYLSLIHI